MTKEQLAKLGITVEEGKDLTEDEIFDLISKSQNDLKADRDNNKKLLSQRNSEIAEYKKKEQDRLSEDEKRELHYKELEEANAKYQRTISRSQKVTEYMDLGYPRDLAEKVADAELDGKSTVELRKQFIASKEESIRAELLKQNPNPSTKGGNPAPLTKDDVLKGGYPAMMKLKAENPDKYKEFFGEEN